MNSIVITGATSGIGFECVTHLAKVAPNKQIILACRNQTKGEKVIQTLKKKTGHHYLICLPLDLSSLTSIKAFKDLFNQEKYGEICALINNAGLQSIEKTKYTEDGFEETFGVNHLGPFYLTLLLMPFMTDDASITFTSSGTHDPDQTTGMPAPEFKAPELLAHPKSDDGKPITMGQKRYTTSKLCNILTVYELQRRLTKTNIRVNAFDPGLVPGTGLARNYPSVLKFISDHVFKILILFLPNVNTAKTSGKRLANLAWSNKYKNAKGKYFEGEKAIKSSKDSYNRNFQSKLWKASVKLTNIKQEETIIPLS